MKALKFLYVGLILTCFSIASSGQSDRIYISIMEGGTAKYRMISVIQDGLTIEKLELPMIHKTEAESHIDLIVTTLDKYLSKGYIIENSQSTIMNTLYILRKED